MTVSWVVQTNLGSSRDIERLRGACARLGLPFAGVTAIPFSDELPDVQVPAPAVAYGSASLMQRYHRARRLEPGVFFDEASFRFSCWARVLGPRVLNERAALTTLRELAAQPRPDTERVFVRPDDDHKGFAGGAMKFGELRAWVGALAGGGFELGVDAPVVAAPPVDIEVEWRLFVVGDRISSGSRYRSGGALDVRAELPREVVEFGREVVERFRPAPVFVLDVAAVGNRLALIEVNGFNSAGFYASDVAAIVADVSGLVDGAHSARS